MRELAEAAGIEIDERNFQTKALTAAEVRELIERSGGVGAVISPRNAAVRERGWSRHPPDLDTFVAAAAADNKMIRRPILVADDQVVVGHQPEAIRVAIRGLGQSG